MEIRENERRFKMEVQFKDLSGWLKTAVVWGFISLGYSVVAFFNRIRNWNDILR